MMQTSSYKEAIECVVAAGQASVSMLQRRFRIGYNRAARIVDMMEARGIVSPRMEAVLDRFYCQKKNWLK